jgi:hypothetical protein
MGRRRYFRHRAVSEQLIEKKEVNMKLVEALNVTLADLMPIKGVAVMVPNEGAAYRISERLHAAMKTKATKDAVPLSALLRELRDELHQAN